MTRNRDRWRAAALLFLVISLVKLFYTSFGLRMLTVQTGPIDASVSGLRRLAMENPKVVGLLVAAGYLLSAIFCFIVATALQQRRNRAILAGQAYAVFQMLGVFFFKVFGILAIVNFVFGMTALVMLGLIEPEEKI